HRHVARAVCDGGDEPASGLSAVVVGPVSADALGLEYVHRHDRVLLYAAVPVHQVPADDLYFRDADDPAGSGGGGIDDVDASATCASSASRAAALWRHCRV